MAEILCRRQGDESHFLQARWGNGEVLKSSSSRKRLRSWRNKYLDDRSQIFDIAPVSGGIGNGINKGGDTSACYSIRA